MINQCLFRSAVDIGFFLQSYWYILCFTVFYMCITLRSFIAVGFLTRHWHRLQNPVSRILKSCCLILIYNKQIFHAVLFNTRNYSPEVINIQRRKAKLNITLPRVNNFDTEQKKAWNICFIICYQHQTKSGKIKTNKTHQISTKTQVFFVKTELRHI